MPTQITGTFEAPTDATLAELPRRAFSFLHALGTQPTVRAVLNSHGYTQEHHLEGWRLLLKVSGEKERTAFMRASSQAASAIAELDAWDEIGFHKAHAALLTRFPDQAAFIFSDLAPTQGPTAVLGVAKFLDRLDDLEKGRDGVADTDKKALEMLASRGIDKTERERLRGLISLAQTEPAIPVNATAVAAQANERRNDLTALYCWYVEWTEIAHATVTKRADKLLLGIAKRKKRERSGKSNPLSGDVSLPPVNGAREGALVPGE